MKEYVHWSVVHVLNDNGVLVAHFNHSLEERPIAAMSGAWVSLSQPNAEVRDADPTQPAQDAPPSDQSLRGGELAAFSPADCSACLDGSEGGQL